MQQRSKPFNGVVAGYDWPQDAIELAVRQAADIAVLVDYEVEAEMALRRQSVPTPIEFAVERGGVVESEYCIVLERPKRIA